MHTAAQNMANLMGSQSSLVLGSAGSTTTVDVNRYQWMMGAIFSQMSSVKGSNAQAAMDNLKLTMISTMGTIKPGQPYRNMSSSFKGMMGGGVTSGGVKTGSTGGSMMGGI